MLGTSISEESIRVTNLIKTYRGSKINAVDGITFAVPNGSFFALLGPNGAGKTTTISILTTTLAKTSGTVQIAGYDLDHSASGVRRSIGVIFQQPSLDLNLTAEENIRFHASLYGLFSVRPLFSMMPKEYQRRVIELAEVLGLSGEIFEPVKTFSGGMRRKLEIIRSLMHRPKVLFLDEPTSGLDPISRSNLWSYLREVRQSEMTTILLTTHYLEEAEEADAVAIINHGRILVSGTPQSIKDKLVNEQLVLASADLGELQHELQRLTIEFSVEDGLIYVPIQGRSAQKIIKQLDTELTVLQINRPTLEEAYLEVVRQSEENNNNERN